MTARAALAGGRYGRGGGWWRHGDGGYGWAGPVFWPFAYYDLYDYALWGDGYDNSFWNYGYGDIYAGMFSPYGYGGLAGYLPQAPDAGGTAPAAGPQSASNNPVASMCGSDSRDIAGLAIGKYQQTLQLNAPQTAALDDLANASVKAAQDIKAACPTKPALTAPDRLAAMQGRLEAMLQGAKTVEPPLDKFFNLLSDEQRARLTGLGEAKRKNAQTAGTSLLAQNCGAGASGITNWPAGQINKAVQPTDAETASLTALQDATVNASNALKSSCPSTDPLTPPARLAAVVTRLQTMISQVQTVQTALNNFYGTLSDEQKAKFDSIGQQLTAQRDPPQQAENAGVRHYRPRVHAGAIARRLIGLF